MKALYVPKLSFGLEKPLTLSGQVHKTVVAPESQGVSFKDALSKTVGSINSVTGAPDQLMKDAMTTGQVDVHDVMIANAKAELVVNVTTQMATKVIQAYDKILQIQI